MSDQLPIPNDILVELEQVRDQVWDLFGHWNLFTGLFTSQERVNVLSWALSAGSAGLIQQAIRTEIAVGLGRLMDPAVETVKKKLRHNLTVERMVNHVEAVRPEQSSGMHAQLSEIRNLFSPLQRWRDKYHAHRDHAVAMRLEPIAQIDRESIDSVLIALHRLMNRVSSALNGSTTPYRSAYENAAEQLLSFVLPKYQATRERLRMDC